MGDVTDTRVLFLGTASVTPEANRDTSCFIINRRILVDTGWNAAINMMRYGVSPLDIDTLILTHCHQDHYIGLPQLLFYRRMRVNDRPAPKPLRIIGPEEDVERVVQLARDFLQVERMGNEIPPEVIPLTPGDGLESEGFKIETVQTVHKVQGMAYRFTDTATGATLAFTGDTGFHPPIADLARGAQLLIHDTSHGPVAVTQPSGHSSAMDSARIAKEAAVARLALVHGREEFHPAALAAARAIFPSTLWPEDGEEVALARS